MVCTSVNLGGLLGSVPLTDGFQRLSRPTNAGHVVCALADRMRVPKQTRNSRCDGGGGFCLTTILSQDNGTMEGRTDEEK